MKDKILSEEGHRQQVKLKELQVVAERLGCTLPQLAIGITENLLHFLFVFLNNWYVFSTRIPDVS